MWRKHSANEVQASAHAEALRTAEQHAAVLGQDLAALQMACSASAAECKALRAQSAADLLAAAEGMQARTASASIPLLDRGMYHALNRSGTSFYICLSNALSEDKCCDYGSQKVYPAAQAAKREAADELQALAKAHTAQAAEAAAESKRVRTALADAHMCELVQLRARAGAFAEAALVSAAESRLLTAWAGSPGMQQAATAFCMQRLNCMHAQTLPWAYLLACPEYMQLGLSFADGKQKQALYWGQVREREAEQAHASLEARLAALQQRFDAREARAEDLAQIAEAQADARGVRAELAALQARMAQQAMHNPWALMSFSITLVTGSSGNCDEDS